ncbi:MAG: divalent-cation tolerance protein CutA [Terriglobales bacterium]
MTDKRIVMTTAGSKEEAQRIARGVVERRAAACVNIVGPMESVYRWQGAVETAAEFLLLIKTTAEAFPRVRDAIVELHSYELPECMMLSVEDGSEAYLNWVADSIGEIG